MIKKTLNIPKLILTNFQKRLNFLIKYPLSLFLSHNYDSNSHK